MNKELFTEFDTFTRKGFDILYPALDELLPMKPSQKKELVYACKDLSRFLTTEREMLSYPYWTNQRLLSAYFHYFMVWNLIRLCRLFPKLDFGTIPQKANFIDLGSGPLTIPLALFLSKKELRQKDITFICTDIAPQPLHIGKNLCEKLRQKLAPECTWKIQTFRAPNHKVLRQIHSPVSLLTMGNVLNESDERKKISSFEQIRQIYAEACRLLDDTGKIFAVEPGTRQGARMIQILRSLAANEIQEEDDENTDFAFDGFENAEAPFQIISPCPSGISCPLKKQCHTQNAWCHFNTKPSHIPHELKELSQKAGLDKDSISLSYLFLAKKAEAEPILKKEESKNKARIISDAFVVPNYRGRARYACHGKGLLLVLDSAGVQTGSLCEVSISQKIIKDKKSHALLCILKNNSNDAVKELPFAKNTKTNGGAEENAAANNARNKAKHKNKPNPKATAHAHRTKQSNAGDNFTKKKRH